MNYTVDFIKTAKTKSGIESFITFKQTDINSVYSTISIFVCCLSSQVHPLHANMS